MITSQHHPYAEGFPGVIGCIDGSEVTIRRPQRNPKEKWRCECPSCGGCKWKDTVLHSRLSSIKPWLPGSSALRLSRSHACWHSMRIKDRWLDRETFQSAKWFTSTAIHWLSPWLLTGALMKLPVAWAPGYQAFDSGINSLASSCPILNVVSDRESYPLPGIGWLRFISLAMLQVIGFVPSAGGRK